MSLPTLACGTQSIPAQSVFCHIVPLLPQGLIVVTGPLFLECIMKTSYFTFQKLPLRPLL